MLSVSQSQCVTPINGLILSSSLPLNKVDSLCLWSTALTRHKLQQERNIRSNSKIGTSMDIRHLGRPPRAPGGACSGSGSGSGGQLRGLALRRFLGQLAFGLQLVLHLALPRTDGRGRCVTRTTSAARRVRLPGLVQQRVILAALRWTLGGASAQSQCTRYSGQVLHSS